METYKLELERNGDHLFISVTFFKDGTAYRTKMLSSGRDGVADSVMESRFKVMQQLLDMEYHMGSIYGMGGGGRPVPTWKSIMEEA